MSATNLDHVMSEQFKYVLRSFRQAVMDARGDILAPSDADQWRQKKMRQQQDFIDQTLLGCGQFVVHLSALGMVVSYMVGHSLFNSGTAGVLMAGTIGLGAGCGLLLKREMIGQQLAAENDDVQKMLQTLQPLRASTHCTEALQETAALLNRGMLRARTIDHLQQLSKDLVDVYHEDLRHQTALQHNQQLINTLLEPINQTQTVAVEAPAISSENNATENDRRHLQL